MKTIGRMLLAVAMLLAVGRVVHAVQEDYSPRITLAHSDSVPLVAPSVAAVELHALPVVARENSHQYQVNTFLSQWEIERQYYAASRSYFTSNHRAKVRLYPGTRPQILFRT